MQRTLVKSIAGMVLALPLLSTNARMENVPDAVSASAIAPVALAETTKTMTDALLPPGFTEGLDEFLSDPSNESAALALGNVLLSNRHLAPAAWMFADAVRNDPAKPEALNNLGAALAELAQSDLPEARDSLLSAANALFDRARELDPETAAYHANFGHTARLMDDAGLAGPGLEAAQDALETATELPGALPLHRLHLAEVLKARGNIEGASAVLTQMHKDNPVDPAYLSALTGLAGSAGGQSLLPSDRNYCSINFQCLKTCPTSIIGRIKVVNCEFAQTDAQQACRAGMPYAASYSCDEEFPKYGILIPGLNAGFSVRTPWGGFDVIHQGDRIDYRWSIGRDVPAGKIVPSGVRITTGGSGSWDPSSGHSVGDLRTGISYNLLNRNTVASEAGRYGMTPVYTRVSASARFCGALEAGVYNGAVWSI